MDIVVMLLVLAAAVMWFVAAASVALLAGRVIRRRDAHDRPSSRSARIHPPLSYPR